MTNIWEKAVSILAGNLIPVVVILLQLYALENPQSQARVFIYIHGNYEWIIMLKKYGRLDLTVFHLIWVIGTYGSIHTYGN